MFRILVAEGDEVTRSLLERTLYEGGYEPLLARSCAQVIGRSGTQASGRSRDWASRGDCSGGSGVGDSSEAPDSDSGGRAGSGVSGS